MHLDTEISLEDAYAGTTVELAVPTRLECGTCAGTGTADKSPAADTCKDCRGSGKRRVQQGFMLFEHTCNTCGGNGRVIRNPCVSCHGSGTAPGTRHLRVPIPAGVDNGTRIRLAGQGEAGGPGTAPGDLYVRISIHPHALFARDHANILMRVPLTMAQAALGTEIELPTIDGSRTKVRVPPGTQTGDQFRLRGKGLQALRGTERGDMFVHVTVETPRSLTSRQRRILEEFEAETEPVGGDGKKHPEHEGFWSKVTSFFDGSRPSAE